MGGHNESLLMPTSFKYDVLKHSSTSPVLTTPSQVAVPTHHFVNVPINQLPSHYFTGATSDRSGKNDSLWIEYIFGVLLTSNQPRGVDPAFGMGKHHDVCWIDAGILGNKSINRRQVRNLCLWRNTLPNFRIDTVFEISFCVLERISDCLS